MYVAIAYRWGWLNNHHYMVYAGSDKTKALSLAQNEASDRGGKYGCVVYEFDEDGTEYQQVGWFHGYGNEAEGPRRNRHQEMLEKVGMEVEQAIKHGTRNRLLTGFMNETKIKVYRSAKASVPRWLRLAYARAKKHQKVMEDVFDK